MPLEAKNYVVGLHGHLTPRAAVPIRAVKVQLILTEVRARISAMAKEHSEQAWAVFDMRVKRRAEIAKELLAEVSVDEIERLSKEDDELLLKLGSHGRKVRHRQLREKLKDESLSEDDRQSLEMDLAALEHNLTKALVCPSSPGLKPGRV